MAVSEVTQESLVRSDMIQVTSLKYITLLLYVTAHTINDDSDARSTMPRRNAPGAPAGRCGGPRAAPLQPAGELAARQRSVFLLLASGELTDQFLSRERPL
ncbi:hypothetical protein EVAR_63086_1 [Eumeta japonica]|uniref:Uncharacterized protein n=1 Tax=Eumeta variegata TaxID=151549 RepID=A0A4C1ZUF5_EUMVA|nr:hypothetical protein EVAR_63086_1 [Eumeta japonica]